MHMKMLQRKAETYKIFCTRYFLCSAAEAPITISKITIVSTCQLNHY